MNTNSKSSLVDELGIASYEMSISINMAQKAFRDLMKICLGHHGLTVPEWTLLGRLYKSDSVRPNNVAKILGVKPPFITRLLATLETQELISWTSHADDGRGKQVSLTPKGRELVEYVEQQLKVCLDEQLGALEQDDLKNYFKLTHFIADNVHHHGM